MGTLPEVRITGVDFCGPISLKRNKGRAGVIDKGYIAVFICLSVKAIHLEIVSRDLMHVVDTVQTSIQTMVRISLVHVVNWMKFSNW